MSKAKQKHKTISSFRKFDDKTFIRLCNKYIDANYPFYEIIEKSSKKLPINAFNNFENILFKLLPSASLNDSIKQIENDLKIITKSYGDYKDIIYFTQSASLARPLPKRKIVNSINSSINFDVISLADILIELNKIGEIQKFESLPSGYLKSISEPQLDFDLKLPNLVEEIFHFIYLQSDNNNYQLSDDFDFEKLTRKINHNFAEIAAPEVQQLYDMHWHDVLAVEKFIEDKINFNPKMILVMYSKVTTEFMMYAKKSKATAAVEDPQILLDIRNSIIPPEHSRSIYHASAALAIVLYFFERCDFGARYKEEQLSLIQKHIHNTNS